MSVLPVGPAETSVTIHQKRRSSLEHIDGMPVLIPLITNAVKTTFNHASALSSTAKKDLRDYLVKWTPNVQLEEAEYYIKEGKRLLAGILNENIVDPIQVDGGSMHALTLLAWCLMSGALKKNQAHYQGSFTIEDQDKLIYRFFCKIRESKTRTSSHYPNRRPVRNPITRMFFSQMGVNVLTGKMPGNQKHLLFGQIKGAPGRSIPLFFFKFEPYSPFLLSGPQPLPSYVPSLEVPLVDVTCHTLCFGVSVWTKVFSPASNDDPDMNKEYPPAATLHAFNAIYQKIPTKIVESVNNLMVIKGFNADVESNKSEYGISYMTQFIDEMKELQENWQMDPILLDAFNASLAELDHRDKRTGREVYFTTDEIQTHALNA